MIDEVILIAILIVASIGVFSLILSVLSNKGGTKGITQPYVTKAGNEYTAKKERSNYIV